MMNEVVPPKEWEEMSMFLDEQLNPKDRERLESQLQQSPELQSALDELRALRSLLRSQPEIKAPRNYSLSADTVGIQFKQRNVGSIFPALSFAAVIASLLFVFVFISDLTYGGPQVYQSTTGIEEQAEMLSMEKALPESAISGEEDGGIGEVQAVPLEPERAEPEMMEAEIEEFKSSQDETPQIEPSDQGVSQPGKAIYEVNNNLPHLLRYLISNRMALRTLEIFLFIVAVAAGMGAFIFYRKRD
jgi:hypothetical protein